MTKEKKELSLTEKLPLEIIDNISDKLKRSNKDVTNFAFVSHATLFVSKKQIEQIKADKAHKLLTHVVKGEAREALRMIKALPKLLLVKSKAKDYSGRIIIGTAFQAALGAEDDRMCQMMLSYFEKIKDGKKEALRQFNEQFPDGLEAELKKEQETAYDFSALRNAIINNADIDGAIKKFRENITANKEIRQGRHFNMQHLITAYNVYTNHFAFQSSSNTSVLFWQKIIGFIQRQMPANYAQAYCSGLDNVLENKNNFRRTFKLTDDGALFPPKPDSGLGFDSALYYIYLPTMSLYITGIHNIGLLSVENIGNQFTQLHDLKTDNLAKLKEQLEPKDCCQPKL